MCRAVLIHCVFAYSDAVLLTPECAASCLEPLIWPVHVGK